MPGYNSKRKKKHNSDLNSNNKELNITVPDKRSICLSLNYFMTPEMETQPQTLYT